MKNGVGRMVVVGAVGGRSQIQNFFKKMSHTLFFGYWKIFLFVGVLTSSGSVVILSGTNPPLWV